MVDGSHAPAYLQHHVALLLSHRTQLRPTQGSLECQPLFDHGIVHIRYLNTRMFIEVLLIIAPRCQQPQKCINRRMDKVQFIYTVENRRAIKKKNNELLLPATVQMNLTDTTPAKEAPQVTWSSRTEKLINSDKSQYSYEQGDEWGVLRGKGLEMFHIMSWVLASWVYTYENIYQAVLFHICGFRVLYCNFHLTSKKPPGTQTKTPNQTKSTDPGG